MLITEPRTENTKKKFLLYLCKIVYLLHVYQSNLILFINLIAFSRQKNVQRVTCIQFYVRKQNINEYCI